MVSTKYIDLLKFLLLEMIEKTFIFFELFHIRILFFRRILVILTLL